LHLFEFSSADALGHEKANATAAFARLVRSNMSLLAAVELTPTGKKILRN
jgi:hypothetical protein